MAGLLALLTSPASRAAIDAQLNTSNFVSGQASEISIDGIVTSGGPSTGIIAAALVLRYDTAQVTVSGLRAGSGWTLEASNQTTTNGGWAKAVLTNMSGNGAGQTVTGPILYFTVTPANGQMDVDDCDTLRFAGVESDLADQGFEQVYPSDPCAGRMAPLGRENPDSGTSGKGGTSPGGIAALDSSECTIALTEAAQIIRIAGGLSTSIPVDLDSYDRNGDEVITITDAVIILRTTCPLVPKGWYTFQGSNKRQGRTFTAISRTPTQQWMVPLPTGSTQVVRDLMPSVVAVPGADPLYPVLYAIVTDGLHSRLYRIADDVSANPPITAYDFPIPGSDPVEYRTFEATGTPMVLLRSGEAGQETIVVNGNDIGGANVLRIDAETVNGVRQFTEVWHRRWPGTIYAAPGFYAGPLMYAVGDGSSTVEVNYGQAAIVAANESAGQSPYGYLLALDLNDDGKRVWGRVQSDGEPSPVYVPSLNRTTVGGLYPFSSLAGYYDPATHSGPAIKGRSGYANDRSCYENARNMRTGELLWEKAYDILPPVESTTVLLADKLYFGQLATWGHLASVAALKENSSRTDAQAWWGLDNINSGLNLTQVYGTPAIHAETGSLVFGDDNGNVFGVGTERHPNYPLTPDVRWPQSYPISSGGWPVTVRCSPLIAGVRNGEATAFVGADDGNVYVFDASSGLDPDTDQPYNVIGPLNGKIRSSMAAYKGRLYVLTVGDPNADPVVPPTLYCFE